MDKLFTNRDSDYLQYEGYGMKELTVTIKGAEQTYKQKFLIYEDFTFDENDSVIKKCIDEALANAKIDPEDIKVRALLVVK